MVGGPGQLCWPTAKEISMSPLESRLRNIARTIAHENRSGSGTRMAAAGICLLAFVGAVVAPASGATLSRSIDVKATPAAVWSMIGPFCAIQDWLPPIGSCVEDGKNPPTRTLVTKDGAGIFVETQTARDDKKHSYSYIFKSSPLPVTQYRSTIDVTAKGEGRSTITWSSTYTPDVGKENDAAETLGHVYDAGLAAIRARFTE
jgi:hypothetical protein